MNDLRSCNNIDGDNTRTNTVQNESIPKECTVETHLLPINRIENSIHNIEIELTDMVVSLKDDMSSVKDVVKNICSRVERVEHILSSLGQDRSALMEVKTNLDTATK